MRVQSVGDGPTVSVIIPVRDCITIVVFPIPTPQYLLNAVQQLESCRMDPARMIAHARMSAPDAFRQTVREHVGQLVG